MKNKKFLINKLDTNNLNFFNYINNFIKFKNLKISNLEFYIKNIIYNIKKNGDKSILNYLKKFEKKNNFVHINVKKKYLEKYYYKLDLNNRFILENTKNRIEKFHNEQKNKYFNNLNYIELDGTILGQKINPIKNIGFYIPGGKAFYPSSIFMNVVPAKLIGCDNLSLSIPINQNVNNDLILSTLFLLDIDNIYNMGGSHAIAALDYGTESVKKVDKIFGPGNIYVSLCKKLIYSDTGIDMVAGPSEVLLYCEKNFENYKSIVMDMFSQSEHDVFAQSIVITEDKYLIENIELFINKYLYFMFRKNTILESLKNRSLFIKTNNINESLNLINYIAPEHLILNNNNLNILKYIKNSGSIFIDKYSSESFGDYNSGLTHVLPTNQNSKFSSPLGIYDFIKKINFLKISEFFFKKLINITSNFAINEKLFSHYESLNFRNL